MKKLCNYRPIVLFCLALIVGISVSLLAKISLFAQIALIALVACLFIVWLILFAIKRTRELALKHVGKFVIIFVAIVVGSLSIFLQFATVKNKQIEKGTYTTYARVASFVTENSYGKNVFDVDNLVVVRNSGREELKGLARVTITSDNFDTNISIGDYIELKATVMSIGEDLDTSYDLNYASKGIYYKIYATEENITSLGKNETLLNEKIQLQTWKMLSENMTQENAAVSFSMFFGKTAFLDGEVLQDFRDSGIAHLLAVSGLHLGFLVMLLSFIARKCKFNKYVEFAFVSVIMFLYSLLCGFSSSVFRAFIMTIILLYSKLRYKEYDSLNSIALSAIIILLINPLKLFDAGFQLSYFAVIGIILLAKPLEDLFSKIFTKKMASSFAVMIAVQLTVTLPTIKFFSNFSVLSLLTNIIAIPIANISFIVLFTSIILSLIMPFMSCILVAAQYFIYPLVWLSNVVAAVPFAVIKTKFNNVLMIAGLSGIIINSDYIFIKRRYKIMTAMLSLLVIVTLFVLL